MSMKAAKKALQLRKRETRQRCATVRQWGMVVVWWCGGVLVWWGSVWSNRPHNMIEVEILVHTTEQEQMS